MQCPSRKAESANRNRKLRLLYLMKRRQRQYLQHAHKTTPDEGGETASPQTGRIRRYIRMTLLCAGILVGIVALTKLLKVPASTAEASTPMEAIDMAQQVEKGLRIPWGLGSRDCRRRLTQRTLTGRRISSR